MSHCRSDGGDDSCDDVCNKTAKASFSFISENCFRFVHPAHCVVIQFGHHTNPRFENTIVCVRILNTTPSRYCLIDPWLFLPFTGMALCLCVCLFGSGHHTGQLPFGEIYIKTFYTFHPPSLGVFGDCAEVILTKNW